MEFQLYEQTKLISIKNLFDENSFINIIFLGCINIFNQREIILEIIYKICIRNIRIYCKAFKYICNKRKSGKRICFTDYRVRSSVFVDKMTRLSFSKRYNFIKVIVNNLQTIYKEMHQVVNWNHTNLSLKTKYFI